MATKTPPTLLLAALTGLTALSIDMSLPAMPQLQQSFRAGVASVQLTLSLFLLGFAVGQFLSGPLSDRWGRRTVLLTGIALFILVGFVCAGSVSLPMLITFRFLQGMGASVGPILARAIVRDCFDSQQAASVLSQITQVMILAPVLAPTVGGYLLVHFGWQAIFLALGSCGALLWLVCWRYLPETLRERHIEAGQVAHVWRSFRTVFRNCSSLRHMATVCLTYGGLFAYISGSPFVFMDVFHVGQQNFGYFFALTACSLMAGATTNRTLLKRHSPTHLLYSGVVVVLVAGLALLLLTWLGVGGLAGVIVPMMGYLFGLGLVQPNATAAAMAPHARLAGAASSLIGGLQTMSGALAGFCVGAFYNHSPFSLGATVATCAIMAFLIFDRSGVSERIAREAEEEAEAMLHVTGGG